MPIPAHGIEEHYAIAPEKYFEHHDSNTKERAARSLMDAARHLTSDTGRLLDIGSGRGEVLRAARDAGWKAVGIEPSPMFADYAAKHSGAEVLREPLEQSNFPAGSFDVVILGAVLEHLYNPDQIIKEISRVLRPGGALFVDVPNENGLYFFVGNAYQKVRGRDWVVNLAPTFPPFHVFGFTPRSLRALLAKHGFKPKRWRVYHGQSLVPAHGGLVGLLEQQAARAVTALGSVRNLGAYIETWAIKR
ncbi:MAG: class I SAM-dependent methyltransferase [Pyrinomonadaceae bacterium]|nr:class I SAM-dependent methyltransferase [Pyrinomonadaceae bacterium]